MAVDDVREQAKVEVRRRLWASTRGKATRTYIREHPEVIAQYDSEGRVLVEEATLPEYVTVSSITLELAQRARRREVSRAVKEWAKDNPEEAARIKQEVLRNDRLPNTSKND